MRIGGFAMKYPTFMKRINLVLAVISGCFMLAIAVLAVMEALLRGVFNAPTIWSADISKYLLLCAIFVGCGYAYQEKGHVGVELVKDAVERKFGQFPKRVMTIIGYLFALVVTIVLLVACWRLFGEAYATKETTLANIDIQKSFLYGVMIFGCIEMGITVLFIILDLFSGDDRYV